MILTHWFVFNGGTGDAQIEFSIFLNAGINESLNWTFFLEKQEGVTFLRKREKMDNGKSVSKHSAY